MNRVNATDPVLVIALILIGAAIAAVLLYGLWRRAHNPNRVEEYDERQRTARLLAYRAAFWSVMVFLGVSALVKAAVLALGAAGVANLWEAVFADVGVSVLAVLNSLRPLAYKD